MAGQAELRAVDPTLVWLYVVLMSFHQKEGI